MDSTLTVADARAALYTEVDASNPNAALFLQRLNELCQRLINNGKWKGSVMTCNFPASSAGFITLPRGYLSLLSLRYRKVPRMSFTQFYPYSTSGPGELDDTKHFPGVAIDLGDGFVTQSDIETAGTLRITIGGAGDAAKVIRLYGEDENGNEIYDSSGVRGLNVTTVNPTVTTTQVFSKVTGIQAAVMTLPWTLSVVNSGTPTQIGAYAPGETRPSYRRYQVGVTTETIQTLCQRRFLPMVAETDWVIPGNLSALRYGLQAMAYEFAGQQDKAEAAYAGSVRFLNEEARAARGGQIAVTNFLTEFSYGVQIGS